MQKLMAAMLGAAIVIVVATAVYSGLIPTPFRSGPPPTQASAIGGPFSLVADDGRVVKDTDFRGEPMIVFFGYTHCPDVCPTTLNDLAQVEAKLPASAKLATLFITVDPERDTPAIMKDYVSDFDPKFIGLSGDPENIDAVMKSYHVYAKKVPGSTPDDYTVDHSAAVYLMDKQGQFVDALDLSQSPQTVAKQLEAYL